MAVVLILVRILWSLAAVTVIATVLLHAAKGDGLAAIGGSAQMFNNKRTAESALDRVTWVAVAVFLITSSTLSLGVLNRIAEPQALPGAPPATPAVPAPSQPR